MLNGFRIYAIQNGAIAVQYNADGDPKIANLFPSVQLALDFTGSHRDLGPTFSVFKDPATMQ